MTVASLLASAGCGTTPPSSFYQLDQAVSPQLTGMEGGIAVGVGPVNVADYLDRPQIVTRSTDNELALAEFHRWAEPLKTSVPRVIATDLSNRLRTARVFLVPRPDRAIPLAFTVAINITRFDGEPDGEATLTAQWTLYGEKGQALLTKMSVVHEATGGPGYDRLVKAQSRALQTLSGDIAAAIEAQRH